MANCRDGSLFIDEAAKSKASGTEIRGTRTGKPKRLSVREELSAWIEERIDTARRFGATPLFPNPRTGRMSQRRALQPVWNQALDAAEMPHVTPYEGMKHTMETDAIRHAVPEPAQKRFHGHDSVLSTRRYARLADHTLVEVLRPANASSRQPGQWGPANETKRDQLVGGGPAWIRTRDRPVMSRLL